MDLVLLLIDIFNDNNSYLRFFHVILIKNLILESIVFGEQVYKYKWKMIKHTHINREK